MVTIGPRAPGSPLEMSGLSKEGLERPRAFLSLASTNFTRRDAWPPTPVAGLTSSAPPQETEREERIPTVSWAPRKRQGKGGQGLHGRSGPAQFPVLVKPPAQSGGRGERARGLAFSGPAPASPPCPPARVRRGGPQGRGRERRAGCTSLRASLRQRARRRERARGKRWLRPGRLGFLGLCSRARRLARPPAALARVPARSLCSGRRPCSSPPRSLDVELAPRSLARSPARPWERPGRAARRGRGGHFVPTDSPEPGGAAGRGCGAAGAAPRRHGRRHRRGFLDEAVREVFCSVSRAAFPRPHTRSRLLRPQNARVEELAVVSSTDPLGLPAASARAAPPNGEEDVRPAFQAAPDRGLGSGQDLRPFSFFGRCLQYHLYFHHR